jgi:hypothetical protein
MRHSASSQLDEAIARPAQYEVRHDGQRGCNDQGFTRINPVIDFDLIGEVKNYREDEYLSYPFPANL